MTPAQRLRLAGFNASLTQRGVLLSLENSDLSFNALIEPVNPDPMEFSVGEQTRDASKIHIVRSAVGIEQIRIGSVLKNSEAAAVHRVSRVEDNPANIAIVFHCETAPVD